VFWAAYPRKVGKVAALKAWDRAKNRPSTADILAAIEAQKSSEQWMKDGGQYIPNPATWLNQGRWDDQPTEMTPKYMREVEVEA
jgi:phage repressor protein C with HTH and peptisase S24 domain